MESNNGLIIGYSRKQKCKVAKQEIISQYLSDPYCKVYIIGSGSIYGDLVSTFGGNWKSFEEYFDFRINPFSVSSGYDEQNLISRKSALMTSIIKIIAGPTFEISRSQEITIRKTIDLIYRKWLNATYRHADDVPTINTFLACLKDQDGSNVQESHMISWMMEYVLNLPHQHRNSYRFSEESAFFAYETELSLSRALTLFDVTPYQGSFGQIEQMLILDAIYTEMCAQKHRELDPPKVIIFIENIDLFFQNDITFRFLKSILENISNVNGSIMGIVDDYNNIEKRIDDVFAEKFNRVILLNTHYNDKIKENFKLTAEEDKYLFHTKQGCGIECLSNGMKSKYNSERKILEVLMRVTDTEEEQQTDD